MSQITLHQHSENSPTFLKRGAQTLGEADFNPQTGQFEFWDGSRWDRPARPADLAADDLAALIVLVGQRHPAPC